MTAKPEPHLAAKPQFPIRLLLVATAAVAVAVWTFVAKPSPESIVATDLVGILTASICVLASLQSTNQLRVFWLGAAMSATVGAVVAIQELNPIVYFLYMPIDSELEVIARRIRISLLAAWCLAPSNGVLCVFVHWLVWPRSRE
jgi:hypothetical protein